MSNLLNALKPFFSVYTQPQPAMVCVSKPVSDRCAQDITTQDVFFGWNGRHSSNDVRVRSTDGWDTYDQLDALGPAVLPLEMPLNDDTLQAYRLGYWA